MLQLPPSPIPFLFPPPLPWAKIGTWKPLLALLHVYGCLIQDNRRKPPSPLPVAVWALIVFPSPTPKRALLGCYPSGSRGGGGLAQLPGELQELPLALPWVFLPGESLEGFQGLPWGSSLLLHYCFNLTAFRAVPSPVLLPNCPFFAPCTSHLAPSSLEEKEVIFAKSSPLPLARGTSFFLVRHLGMATKKAQGFPQASSSLLGIERCFFRGLPPFAIVPGLSLIPFLNKHGCFPFKDKLFPTSFPHPPL